MEQTEVQTIIEDKCWIVTQQGVKLGTVMRVDEVNGGVVFVHDNQRERFRSIGMLMSKYKCTFKHSKTNDETAPQHVVFGFPSDTAPFNTLIDARKRLPLYTKTASSKSYHAAGFYQVKYVNTWLLEFCPKLLTLDRNEFLGPFTDSNAATLTKGTHK